MEGFEPHIGKNVIETLTLGMYENALFIFREYVQNAADQIDIAVEEGVLENKSNGEIDIVINKNEKVIIIEDNATGIKNENVLQFLGDVANSQKNPEKRKGFRGIGRLGGLGYCDKLIFETTYKGENIKNIITLNAKQLRSILEDKTDTSDASTVISTITSLSKEECSEEKHSFKVILQNVENEILLDEERVFQYLSMVAPVPYHPDFSFKNLIYSYYKTNKIAIDEYDVRLRINEVKLYKPYKSIFYKKEEEFSNLLEVICFKILNNDDETIGIGWYGITNKLNHQIPEENIEGGIRLRKENIGIGGKLALSPRFGQSRQNLNYIGEVHAIGYGFTPNARRDYFNDSKTCSLFEAKLESIFSSLGGLTQDSSQLHNRKKDVTDYRQLLVDYEEKSNSGDFTARELESLGGQLVDQKDKAVDSMNKILKLKEKSIDDKKLRAVYSYVISDLDVVIDNNEFDLGLKTQTYPITLSTLNLEKKKLVLEIFSIIGENLSLEKAEMIKKKIAEYYN